MYTKCMSQSFGGEWTDKKLQALVYYLEAYLTIMHGNERARSFRTTYLDGFAGSGRFKPRQSESQMRLGDLDDEYRAVAEFALGSPMRVLNLNKLFDRYIFIDRSRRNVRELQRLSQEFPDRNIHTLRGDANKLIREWVKGLEQNDRAVAFLDPFGMEVEWATIEAIGATRKIDMWLLVPVGQAIVRLMPRTGLIPEWNKALTRFFGTDEWQARFFPDVGQRDLFGVEGGRQRMVNETGLTQFMTERLHTCFPGVLDKPIPLRNKQGLALFYLYFAVGNEVAVQPALRIARDAARKFAM